MSRIFSGGLGSGNLTPTDKYGRRGELIFARFCHKKGVCDIHADRPDALAAEKIVKSREDLISDSPVGTPPKAGLKGRALRLLPINRGGVQNLSDSL